MNRPGRIALAALLGLAAAGASAQPASQALVPEVFLSSDADGSEVQRWGLGWDISRRDHEHWLGVKLERARFAGEDWSQTSQRVFLRAAGTLGGGDDGIDDDTWRWQLVPGTDGDALIGRARLHTEGARRKEFFIERDQLETRGGIERGQIHTFAGAAIDHPLGPRWNTTLLAGLQEFGDSNLRTHLRGTLVHSLIPDAGLSLQLRTRYYRNSDPFAGDYFSPPWYGEAIAAVGLRRFFGGHGLNGVVGWGRQKVADDASRRARMLQLGYESPRWRDSRIRIIGGYTDTPVASSGGGAQTYSYRYLMVEAVIAF